VRKLVIDIGYGDVKFKADDYLNKFPSTFVQETIFKDFKGEIRDRGYYKTGERKLQYIIGLKNESDKGEIDYINRYDELVKFAPFFIYHAIQILKKDGIDTHFDKLVTGLTLREWNKKEKFFNAVKEIDINGEKITFDKRIAYIQGQGIYYNNTTEEERKKYICVLDIGYNTVDILLFKDSRIIEEKSTVRTFGVEIMVNNLQNFINQQYEDENISEQQAKIAIEKKEIDIKGNMVDIESVVNDLISKFAVDTIHFIEKHLRKYSVSKVIISGGGAYLLENVPMRDLYVFSKKPYEFQNVIGYYERDKNKDKE
jgi:hypothetical protein